MSGTGTAPLSLAQRRLWLIEQLEPASAAYHTSIALRVRGRLDLGRLERSVAVVVARHEPLRTNFGLVGGEPVQLIHDAREHPIAFDDLYAIPAGARHEELQQRMVREVQRPFDLATGPLMRLTAYRTTEGECVLLVVMHHIVSDGWSMGVFARELLQAYAALGEGRTPDLRPPAVTYSEHARRQQAALGRGELRDQIEWWKARLAGAPSAMELPTDRPRPPTQGYRGGLRTLWLPPGEAAAVERLARGAGATPFMVLLAALAAVAHRYSGSSDLIIGTAIANRNRADIEELIGFFVNTLPIRIDLAGEPTFAELLARVRRTAIEAFDHQDAPFDRLVEELRPPRDLSRPPIVQLLLVVQNMPIPVLEQGGLRLDYLEVEWGTGRFDFTLYARPDAGGLKLLADYDADLFDSATIDRLLAHLRRALEGAAANPARRLADLDLGGAEERCLLDEWNRTAAPYPEATLADLFEAQAARTPDAAAVVDEGGMLSFAELNARANRLSHHLRRQGVGEGDIVAVVRERSAAAVAALLAVMKAGAAYLPIDPEFPAERVAWLLDDARARVIVSGARLAGRLPRGMIPVVLDDARDLRDASPANPARTAGPDDLAYVLYTSGSTGRPKAVLGLHRGMVNRLAWGWRTYPFGPGEVCCARTPLVFVDSLTEVLGPLLAGVPLVIARDEGTRVPGALVELLARHAVTRLVVVPSLLRPLLDVPGELRARLPALRIVVTSGERLGEDLLDAFRRRLPGVTLLNLYGSSEVSGDVTASETTAHDDGSALIGRPIANTRVYVLDAAGGRTPIGVPGEIVVGGVGLARGYLNRPELTAAKFGPDPFVLDPYARVYRTGDRGRLRADGSLEYLGRLDRQLKIRGVRVEPAETEAALGEHPAVCDAVVGSRERRRGDPELVAWFVAAAEPEPTAEELRGFLAARLPLPQVPSLFVRVAELPRTPSGKVDLSRLAGPPGRAARHVPPRKAIERLVAGIWESLLNTRPIGIEDDFFELGGHSMLALRLVAEIERETGQRLPLAALFTHSTVAALVRLLRSGRAEQLESGPVVLHPEGRDRPLAFAQSRLGAQGFYCHRLAQLMDPDTPLILLPGPRRDAADAPRTIEEMAADFLGQLRAVQPAGPYRVAGFCRSGLIAYELARQLREQGEVVERLVILDTWAWNAPLRSIEPLLRFLTRARSAEASLRRRAALLWFLRYYPARLVAWVRMPWREQARWLLVRRLEPGEKARGMRKPPLALAERAFIPQPYDGEVDLIAATQWRGTDATHGWGRVARAVRVHEIKTTHMGLVMEALPEVAERLRACLAGNGSAGGG